MAKCSRCKLENFRAGSRYCRECHAAYQRKSRKPPTGEQRVRDIARSYAGVYKRRGKLTPEPCEACGFSDVQMHHDDYARPLAVRWLCRECHQRLHHVPRA